MYIWSENVAERGAQEIASCLKIYLKNHITKVTKHIILYSDSCVGQNRYIQVTLLLKHFLASSSIDFIEQNFFFSGNSYNSCDRYFGSIEKERKLHKIINDPNHWIDIIKESKQNYPKFEVTKMQTTDFVTSQELQQLIVNRKVDMHKEKINWLKIRSTKLDREKPFHLYIIYEDEKVREVSIAKKKISVAHFKNVQYIYLPELKFF